MPASRRWYGHIDVEAVATVYNSRIAELTDVDDLDAASNTDNAKEQETWDEIAGFKLNRLEKRQIQALLLQDYLRAIGRA